MQFLTSYLKIFLAKCELFKKSQIHFSLKALTFLEIVIARVKNFDYPKLIIRFIFYQSMTC